MDEGYYHYFQGAFESPSTAAPDPLVIERVRDAIYATDAALEESTGHVLRPDARWFLLFVFSELMAQPVLAVRGELPEQVLPQLAADVRTVALVAGELANEREVSRHVIVDALSQRWDDLELTRARWWE